MKVNIGILKNELSRYLKEVRDGNEVIVTDRNEPIAKIVPLERPLVRADLRDWLKRHPPIKTVKKQTKAAELVREIRDEE